MKENHQANPKITTMPKGRTWVKPRKQVDQVLKTRTPRKTQKLRNLHRRIPPTILTRTILGVMTAGVTMNGMLTGVRLDGMKVGIKSMAMPQAHFHMEVLILVSSAVRSGLFG